MLCAHMEVFMLFVFTSTDQAGSQSYLTLQYSPPEWSSKILMTPVDIWKVCELYVKELASYLISHIKAQCLFFVDFCIGNQDRIF